MPIFRSLKYTASATDMFAVSQKWSPLPRDLLGQRGVTRGVEVFPAQLGNIKEVHFQISLSYYTESKSTIRGNHFMA